MAAVPFWARETFGNFVYMHIAVINLDKKLHWALQPSVYPVNFYG